MTASLHRMLEGISAANKAEQSYLKKLREYNWGMFEMKNNLQKIILPTVEAKQSVVDKLKEEQGKAPVYPKTDADKAKDEVTMQKDVDRHNKLNARILELLNTLTEQGVINGQTTAEITQTPNDNVEASSQAINQLLTHLINNFGVNNKPILELIKISEANLINKD